MAIRSVLRPLLALACGILAPAPARSQSLDDSVRNRMQGIFTALSVVYPVSLDRDAFRAPENHEPVLRALDEIAANAGQLAGHGSDRSEGFRLISRSLAEDARNALELFEAGDIPGTRFHVDKLTNTCFACHSRFPPERRSELGKVLLENPRVRALPLRSRMKVAVAARQFETGADLGEALMASSEVSATAMDLTGVIDDYLKIVIRVQRDLDRAEQALARFREREDLPAYLATYVETWIESLEDMKPRRESKKTLELARGLIRDGQVMNRYPADRRGLIQFMMASSLLHQIVAETPPTAENAENAERLAEMYYLLGMVESTLSRTSWTAETEYYLESAIRSAPRTEFARDAYRLLEEYLILGYTGSAGVHLPPDVEAYLWELQDLIEQE